MNILLTNDDGFDAPGIQILHQVLTDAGHTALLVAPDREKSAVGHGISLNVPLRMKQIHPIDSRTGYAVSGTPADCVKLALFELYEKPPELVIAGINPGSNTGVNINYSGTVAAAREAAFNGVPAAAVSLELAEKRALDYKGMAHFIRELIAQFGDIGLDPGIFLNINCPDRPVRQTRGIRITTRSALNVSKILEKRNDPKGRAYFWYGRASMPKGEDGSDIQALRLGYISITPMGFSQPHAAIDTSRLKRLEQTDYLSGA